jgi:hypothetical protein
MFYFFYLQTNMLDIYRKKNITLLFLKKLTNLKHIWFFICLWFCCSCCMSRSAPLVYSTFYFSSHMFWWHSVVPNWILNGEGEMVRVCMTGFGVRRRWLCKWIGVRRSRRNKKKEQKEGAVLQKFWV